MQKRLAHSKLGIIGRSLLLHQEGGCTMQKMGMESCKQIFGQGDNLIKHLKVGRCTGVKTKIICSGGKFGHILNSSDKVFHGGDTKFSYTACQ